MVEVEIIVDVMAEGCDALIVGCGCDALCGMCILLPLGGQLPHI